jgi:hypothetical protein
MVRNDKEHANRRSAMLNAFALPDDVALCDRKSRGRLLKVLVAEFRTAFAGIEYGVDTQTPVVNAQAFGDSRGCRVVRLYGGLAFHPLVSEDALVFALLHETGHHRAPGRRFAGDPMLACDCLADKWAVGAGATALRRSSGRMMNLPNALDSLGAMIASIDVGTGHVSAAPTRRSHRRQACWAAAWSMRKLRLTSGSLSGPTGRCYYTC